MNYIEVFMKENNLKTKEKFRIMQGTELPKDDYYINCCDGTYRLISKTGWEQGLLLELLSGQATVCKYFVPEYGEEYYYFRDYSVRANYFEIEHRKNFDTIIDKILIAYRLCHKTEFAARANIDHDLKIIDDLLERTENV